MAFADDVVLGRRLQGVKEVFRSVAEQTKMTEEKTNFMRV